MRHLHYKCAGTLIVLIRHLWGIAVAFHIKAAALDAENGILVIHALGSELVVLAVEVENTVLRDADGIVLVCFLELFGIKLLGYIAHGHIAVEVISTCEILEINAFCWWSFFFFFFVCVSLSFVRSCCILCGSCCFCLWWFGLLFGVLVLVSAAPHERCCEN